MLFNWTLRFRTADASLNGFAAWESTGEWLDFRFPLDCGKDE
jgi:hypothetical protein